MCIHKYNTHNYLIETFLILYPLHLSLSLFISPHSFFTFSLNNNSRIDLMGNKLGRGRQVVEEKYTRPQGLYLHKDVDQKKLRKLILDSKLAPCYPGDEECVGDREECPICFLYYPSLNRSRCCTKGICTECFLQMKAPNSTRPTQCPFCKTSNYAVEYWGVKTKEEKGKEQIEEQRVIEAKIRMRRQELQDDEEKMLKRQEISSSSRTGGQREVECSSVPESEDIVSAQDSCAGLTVRQALHSRQNRDNGFDLDLEDIMVMEAIWLSIQENGRHRNPAYGDAAPSEQYIPDERCISAGVVPLTESSSPSGGLACAIAALAERQQIIGESSNNYTGNMSAYNMIPGSSTFSNGEEQVTHTYPTSGSSIEAPPDNQLAMTRDDGEWGVDNGSVVAQVGTSYADSDAAEDVCRNSAFPSQDGIDDGLQPVAGPIFPESFEEQMMLAMAVSLAETRAMTSPPGVAWH